MKQRKLKAIVMGPLGPPYGGPEVMTQTLIDGLKRRDEIEFAHIDTQVSRSLAEKGGHNQARKSLRGFLNLMELLWHTLRMRPDVVYLPLTNSPSFLGFIRDAAAIVVARLTGSRAAIRLHGGFYYYVHETGWRLRFVRSILRRVDLATVQGQRLVSCFNGLLSRERIAVVTNGIDDAPFAAARARRSGRADRVRILFIGLLCEGKGVHDIIASMPLVPEAEFVFVGEWASPSDRERAMQTLQADGTASRARFTGVVSGDEKYDILASSDIYVFPTSWVYEGHAVTSVEALAAGLPIVCTDHGALNESVRDGWNGFFVPAHSPESIAERLLQLVRDPDLRSEMARRSRQLYEDRFTVERFLSAWTQTLAAAVFKDVGASADTAAEP